MGKKGLNTLIFCTFVSLFLLFVPLFVSAGACFYHTSFGSCLNVATNEQCTTVGGTAFDADKTLSNMVPSCQLTGCCCVGDQNSPQAFATVSSEACTQIPTSFAFHPVSGLGFIASSATETCTAQCGLAGGEFGESTPTDDGTTVPDTGTNGGGVVVEEPVVDSEPNVLPVNLDDCRSKITGTVTSTFGIPEGLLVYSQSDRANAWGNVFGDGTFTIDGVCAGDHEVSASDIYSAYSSTRPGVTVAQDATASGVIVDLIPLKLGTIKGTVVSSENSNTKVVGALVRVSGFPYYVRTNSTGGFTLFIPNVEGTSKEYTLMISTGTDTGTPYLPKTEKVILSDNTVPARTEVLTIPLIPQTCSGTALPVITSNVIVKGSPQVTLTWSMPSCESSVLYYLLQKCEGNSLECTFTDNSNYVTISDIASKTYLDNLEWNKNYTYRVGAVYPGPVINVSTTEVTIYSGDRECEGITASSFCGSAMRKTTPFVNVDAKMTCSDSNIYVATLCAQSEICAFRENTYVNGAQCVAPESCVDTQDENPFGLYSSQNLCAAKKEKGTCYFDRTTSNVNSCLNCKQGMTCSDYKTKSACNFDSQSCDVKNCAWADIDPILGIGVCKTTKVPTCGDCNSATKSPFGVCNAQTCAAFGTATDGCFYASTATTTSCTACSATQCGNYTSQDSCEGSGRTSTIMDIVNNNLTQTSADACGMKVCKWLGSSPAVGSCVKDANDDETNDCAGSSDVKKCNLDRTPPTTFVVMPNMSNPFVNNVTIRFIPQDKGASGSNQVLMTQFCISSDDGTGNQCTLASQFAKVQQTSTNTIVNITDGIIYRPGGLTNSYGQNIAEYTKTLDRDGGAYTLHYYSVDISKNIEVVRTKKFIINTTPPTFILNVSKYVVPAAIPQNTDIVASVTSAVDVRCHLSVVPFADAVYSPDSFTSLTPKIYSKLHESVFRRSDGTYMVKATCRDVNGNVDYINQTITTNADTRVQNVKPAGLLGTSNPVFSIETKQPVVCKMTTDATKFDNPQGVSAEFNSYELTMERTATPVGAVNGWYNHTLQLPGAIADGAHNYKIICDFNQFIPRIVSFTVNTQTSPVIFKLGNGENFDFTKWHQDLTLRADCNTDSSSGIACVKIEYCKIPKAFGPLGTQTCTPNINVTPTGSVSPRFVIPFDTNDRSTVLCARGVESLGSGASATIRYGAVRCESVLLDRVDPKIKMLALPTLTSKQFVSLNGSVFDPVFVASAISFPATGINGAVGASFADGKIVASNLFINGTLYLLSNGAQPSYIEITLRNGTSSPVVAKIDMTKVHETYDSKVSIYSGGQLVAGPTNVPLLSAIVSNWSILLDETFVNVTVNGVSTIATVTYDRATSAGLVAFKAYNLGAGTKPDVRVEKVSLVDLDISDSYPLSLVVQVGAGQDGLSSQVAIGSMGDFSKNVPFANSYDEDTTHSLKVWAKDTSSRISTVISGNVMFSTAGPKITNLTFTPENLQQANKSYIEFEQNATAKVFATSGYGLNGAVLRVPLSTNDYSIQLLNKVSDGFTGRFDTYGLPTGYSDVLVNVTDTLGTISTRTFAKALLIRNTLNPERNISLAYEIITNNTKPTLTFPVVDESSITCTATYVNATGGSKVDTFVGTGTNSLTLALSQPLKSIPGEMVETPVYVACNKNSAPNDKWRHTIYITVDLRAPVIAASLVPVEGVSLTPYLARDIKMYVSYFVGDKVVHIAADEPVVCQIDGGSNILIDGETRYAKSIYTTVPTIDQMTSLYVVSCVDEAGNLATTTRRIVILTNTSAEPYIVKMSPEKYITSLSTPVNVVTTVSANCSINVPAIMGNLISMVLEPVGTTLPANYAGTLTFTSDGVYPATLACTRNGQTTTRQLSFVVDTTAPIVTSTQLLPLSGSDPVKVYSQTPNLAVSATSNEPIVVSISDSVGVFFEQQLPSGTSSIEIPLKVGVTDSLVVIRDLAGNNISSSVQFRRAGIGFTSQFVDLLPYSTRSTISGDSSAKVTLSIISDAYKMTPLNSSQVSVVAKLFATGSTNSITISSDKIKLVSDKNGASANLSITIPNIFPLLAHVGTYMLTYVVSVNGTEVAADSAVFTIDNLAESIHTLKTFNVTQRNRQSIAVNLSVPYMNLISTDTSAWNEESDVVDRFFEKAKAQLDVPAQEASSLFSYYATNELGHIASVKAQITHDIDVPTTPVIVTLDTLDTTSRLATPTSSSPVPQFAVTYPQPLRIISSQIKQVGSSAVVAVNALDVADQQFYDGVTLRSASRLNDGNYELYLTLANSAGTLVAVNQKFAFNVKAGTLNISLVNPPFGRTSTDILDFVIGTDRPSNCKFSLPGTPARNFTDSDGLEHSIQLPFNGPDTGAINYIVSCSENGTLVPVINKTIALEKNTVAPQITSLIIPTLSNGIMSNPYGDASLNVVTSTPSVCRYTKSGVGFNSMNKFDNYKTLSTTSTQKITEHYDGESYNYTVICENGAGVTSDPASISFTVNVSYTGLISIKSPKNPVYDTQSIPVLFTLVRPALDTQGCVWSKSEAGLATANYVNPTSADKMTYNLSSLTFAQGNNEFYVKCRFPGSETESGGVKNETAVSRFIVDITPPEKGYVIAPNTTTKKNKIENVKLVFKDNESGISLYEYAVGTAPYGSSGWNSTKVITGTQSSEIDIDGLNLTNGTSYYVSARAKNAAGKPSDTWATSNATIAKLTGSSGGVIVTNSTSNITTTVTLINGTVITYTNGSTYNVPNGTKIIIPGNYSGVMKPGATVNLPAGTKLILPDGTVKVLPVNTKVTLPAAIVTTSVVTQTLTSTNTTNSKNQTNNRGSTKTNTSANNQEALDLPSAFGASLLLFLLTLGLIGGGAGYYFYARKQRGRSATNNNYGGASSAAEEVVVPRGPLTVNDKLKLALQSRIRKQRGEELPSKTSQLFSAFGKDSKSTSATSTFTPRIGVTKSSPETAGVSRSPILSSSDTSKDIDKTLERTQLSLDRLKSIADKQKPMSQLRRLQSKSSSSSGSALNRLRSLHKK